MDLIDFFVVGAPKCGTSSLYHYLKQHPEIFLPDVKEPHYYTHSEVSNGYYKGQYVTTAKEYETLYAEKKGRRAGDMSPSYLYWPDAPKRIHQENPNAKIIIILREPVSRAISHYLMDVRLGFVKKPLREILDNSSEPSLQEYFREYVKVGMYSDQVSRYLEYFGDNVSIFWFNEFSNQPELYCRKICELLSIDTSFQFDTNEVANSFSIPRSRIIDSFRKSDFWAKNKNFIPSGLKNLLKPHLDIRKKPDLQEEKDILQTMFKAENLQLETLLETPVPWNH